MVLVFLYGWDNTVKSNIFYGHSFFMDSTAQLHHPFKCQCLKCSSHIRGLIQKSWHTSWKSLKSWQTVLKVCIHTTHCIYNKHIKYYNAILKHLNYMSQITFFFFNIWCPQKYMILHRTRDLILTHRTLTLDLLPR